MSVSTVSSSASDPYAAVATATSNGTPIVSAPQTLGSADFMKLLAVQFQSQDPMKPMDDTAFIAQMAQFTALSQTQTMTATMAKLNTSQQLATANTYIGQQVTVDDGNGGTASGIVSGVQVDPTNGPELLINGTPYQPTSVLLVQPASAATAAAAATPTTATTSPGTSGA